MNNMNTDEKISELVDRQSSARARRELFERMRADHGACETWRRSHLIGNVLRGEVSQCGGDLSARIGAQLEAEPTLLAPRKLRKPFFNRRALAASLAASIALLAVVSLTLISLPSSRDNAAIANAKARQEFDVMLSQHGEFASSPGLNGLIVYATLVSDQPLRNSRR